MDVSIRPMVGSEKLYCYTQSQQIIMQSGNIGYLRADMEINGESSFFAWNDYHPSLNTPIFRNELSEVMEALRQDEKFGKFLSSRSNLREFCRIHPEALIDRDDESYGVRADTKEHTYMIRVHPIRVECNLYCYCYRRDLFEKHMSNAERGIRIISSGYREKFRIPDGERIRIITRSGDHRDMTCRYIDDYHMETNAEWGNTLYHICEFAERFEERGCQDIFPLRSTLPETCYSVLESDGSIIMLTKGQKSYLPSETDLGTKEKNKEFVRDLNSKLGVTRAQEEAMKAGSMFGWAVLAADPKNYDEHGMPRRIHSPERGEER